MKKERERKLLNCQFFLAIWILYLNCFLLTENFVIVEFWRSLFILLKWGIWIVFLVFLKGIVQFLMFFYF